MNEKPPYIVTSCTFLVGWAARPGQGVDEWRLPRRKRCHPKTQGSRKKEEISEPNERIIVFFLRGDERIIGGRTPLKQHSRRNSVRLGAGRLGAEDGSARQQRGTASVKLVAHSALRPIMRGTILSCWAVCVGRRRHNGLSLEKTFCLPQLWTESAFSL